MFYVNGNDSTVVQSEYSVITTLYTRHCACNCRCCGTEIPCGWTRQRGASWKPEAVDIHLSSAKCRRQTSPTIPAWRTTRSARPDRNSSYLVSILIALFLYIAIVWCRLSLHDCQYWSCLFNVVIALLLERPLRSALLKHIDRN